MPSYEEDISIDETALDIEWLDHPRRMMVYCENAAEAHRDMDLAKERVEFIKSRLDQEIRQNPMAFGLTAPRITEGSIQSVITTHEDYVEASRDYIEKKYIYEVAQGAVRAFEHRKSALENLVRLHGQNYFAGPSVPHNLSEERARRVNESIRIMRRGR